MDESGQLIKVLIHAFDDEGFQRRSKLDKNPISLPVNPESFSQNFKVELNQQQGQGNQGTNPDYMGTKPEELKLDFTFDGTQTIEGYAYNSDDPSVKAQLDIFMKTVYDMNGEIHRPHFLSVQWGDFTFPCILSNLDLNYSLFKANGDPLRIKASATFLNYIAQQERVARERKKSPDLTHVRLVKAGDRLDHMVHTIYDDPKYVTQVARANGLTTFREIEPGVEMVFPPLDKTVI
ncbi:hypothetical protein RQM65_06185 [Pricia sp. S334]|uniref:Contractile injection system tube protein N-terminal domain-containing protein n=1 Tax=Pricia mediterranea TaxID=3076079 RepID=A0ABU3L3C1_9FLAO|nr:hypothetical protein [Pricia sp. S334]MDT7828246.1 hypothetical protein [Pricia sp. S334]